MGVLKRRANQLTLNSILNTYYFVNEYLYNILKEHGGDAEVANLIAEGLSEGANITDLELESKSEIKTWMGMPQGKHSSIVNEEFDHI
jgi:hypothetical protein